MNHVFRNATRATGATAQPATRATRPRLVIENLDAAPEQGYVPVCGCGISALPAHDALDIHGQIAA
ncbi:hypothetical protein AB0K09_26805 [Streptomyces sp. NPDC049577]|uniref:hypothetical protein n=1 Tax=Streptomyces sp. NPDC049577 TaxID=3155153 RepID=UPI003445CB78